MTAPVTCSPDPIDAALAAAEPSPDPDEQRLAAAVLGLLSAGAPVSIPAVHAMCAIDALGLPAMAGSDGQITATDPHDGAPVQVSVQGSTWRWTPPEAVVVYGRTADCGTGCGSWEAMCPHTTFHASRDSAQAYLAARPGIDGEILGQQAAIDLGRRIFGPLLGRAA
jgi:alkylmercury lyase